jgi:cholesterol transport system auxiliary component
MRQSLKPAGQLAVLLTFAILALASCGFSRPYPLIRAFTLEADIDPSLSSAYPLKKQPLVQVVANGSVASYETRKLIRRVGPNELTEDFYHEFTGLPARILADETARFLDFGPIVQAERVVSIKDPDLVLELFLLSFYGDFTTPAPAAVIEVRYTLTDTKRGDKVLLAKSYRGQSPINTQASDPSSELVSSLEQALSQILSALQNDLEKVLNARR